MRKKKFVWQIGMENLRAAYEEALTPWKEPLAERVKELGRPLTYEEAYEFLLEFEYGS